MDDFLAQMLVRPLDPATELRAHPQSQFNSVIPALHLSILQPRCQNTERWPKEAASCAVMKAELVSGQLTRR